MRQYFRVVASGVVGTSVAGCVSAGPSGPAEEGAYSRAYGPRGTTVHNEWIYEDAVRDGRAEPGTGEWWISSPDR